MEEMPKVEMVTRSFRIAAGVGTAWFLIQMLGTRSDPMVYLLFALVQGVLLAVSFIRRDLVLRLIAGVYGGLLLLILGAIAWLNFTRPGGISCWNLPNVVLPVYIGGSHLAFAISKRG